MKTILFTVIIFFLHFPLAAQTKSNACSEDDFQVKKKAYMAKEAGLTKEEADKFFPLYFEMLKLKKENNSIAWEQAKKVKKNKQATEADFEASIQTFIETEEKNAQLEKEYLKKGKEIIPPSKIFKVLHAEIKFNRNILKILHGSEADKK